MKAFGFLSFGHYGHGRGPGDPDAGQALKDAVEIAVGADEIGVNGAYWRVHHYARQAAAPIPLLSAAGARTKRIEVGTGVIDMRYENPLHLAEEVAALDLLTDQRIAIGISRGSPEQARRGWETFGYVGGADPRSIFPIVSDADRRFFALRGEDSHDQIGIIDGLQSTFGRTYAAEPDVLIEQLAGDEALRAADTVMLTIPSQLGVDFNLHILQAFAEHVAPALGWQPNTAGPVMSDAPEE